ncbi:disease resistance protein [Populus alba x Populus x berolinensis]|nr:disease resistance protein [Populus alba x Populus x berolinensis]
MVLENIISVIDLVSHHTVVPIAREINYCFKYNHNFENLKREVKKLKSAQLRVQHLVDDARNNGEEILEDVIKWLSLVEEASEKVEREILEDEDRARKKCFLGLCPDLKARYQCSKKAKEETRFVASLLDERDGFSTVSRRAAPKGMEAISFRSHDVMPSRTPVLKEIMNALTTADVNMVGVYGMRGMGKTVLVKEAARQAIQEKLFNQVVFATITQTPDIKQIQGQIADQLCLKFDEESEWGRAGRLRQRLKQEQKILIILDDLWKSLDLEAVGIPLKDEHEGCKMLLTSRVFDVLSSGMDIQKNFPINALSEEETWEFFKKMAGDHFFFSSIKYHISLPSRHANTKMF